MIFWICIVLTLLEPCYCGEGEGGGPPKVTQPDQTNSPHHVFPIKIDETFVTEEVDWKLGYRQDYPPYISMYDAPTFDILMYIFPPSQCQAVWLCFPRIINASSADAFYNFKDADACGDSLRFHPLEQMVYVIGKIVKGAKGGQGAGGQSSTPFQSKHPYWSNVVQIEYSTTSDGQTVYKFLPYASDFDGEDITKLTRAKPIELQMESGFMMLFTSSPYCGARIMRPLQGALTAKKVLFWGKDVEIFRSGPDPKDKPSLYYLTGTHDGSKQRQNLYKSYPATAFDSPNRKTAKAQLDCCPSPYEFEGFLLPGEWIREPKISYLKYKLGIRSNIKECASTSNVVQFHSVLLEKGVQCEWVRLCFDRAGSKMCSDDVNTLAFIFVHNMMIPTDSDEARIIGLDFNELDAFRINFIKGSKGIEVGYAFTDHVSPGIRELMQLEVYDGVNPASLELTLVRSPSCEARLLNDLGNANIRYGNEYDRQCLQIKQCECHLAA